MVGEPGAGTDELVAALSRDGMVLAVAAPGECELALRDRERPDVVLFAASLGSSIGNRLTTDLAIRFGTAAPLVLAFADTGLTAVAELARHGFDYLLPPYPPAVIRARMSALAAEAAQRRAEELAMYERELQIGRQIQQGFLPVNMPSPGDWQMEVFFRPAREVAGDFYDGFEMVNGRRFGLVVADVCDKGVGSALFMALIRSLIRYSASRSASLNVAGLDVEWAERLPGPDGVPSSGSVPDGVPSSAFERGSITTAGVAPLLSAVAGTSAYMTDNHLEQGYFATLFFGVLDPGSGDLLYINCGHNPPRIRRADGQLVRIQPTGPALGMLAGSTFRVGQARLDPGDLLYVFTDGVSEARNAVGEQFGEDRLDAIISQRVGSAADVLSRVENGLAAFVGAAGQFDDITMMALYHPSDADPVQAPAAGEDRR